MRDSSIHSLDLNGQRLEYRMIESAAAKCLRVRVRSSGVEVIRPAGRTRREVNSFLREKATWVESQIERTSQLNGLRKSEPEPDSSILLRGKRFRLEIREQSQSAINRIHLGAESLTIFGGSRCSVPVGVALENWLRRQARKEIMQLLPGITRRLRREPYKIFVMGQRTKWGNCSAKRILSFNWRLIMAPPFVMRYLVTHEVVHLAVPDHSVKFWLMLQSHCPESEKARQWLAANGAKLLAPIKMPSDL